MVVKRIFLFFFIFPSFLVAQRTFIPDDSFEQVLINLDLDDIFDDSVNTSAIDTLQLLEISNKGITDLTGIEDFSALSYLFCHNNQLQELDLSNNTDLFEVNCSSNQLVLLSIQNGNQNSLWYLTATNNSSSLCIEVDNVFSAYTNYSWLIDATASYSDNCEVTSINDLKINRKLIEIVDSFGRKVISKNNQLNFYLYDNGTVEKRLLIE